jgi:hypothetical protein
MRRSVTELERLAAHTGRVDDAFAGCWFRSPGGR